MKNNSPSNIWNDMAPGSFRRVDAEIKHNIFWFRDIHGAYGLRISLTQLFKRELDEKLEGVSLLRRNKGSNGELFILLTNNEDWEIFLVLCLNLISISDRYLDEENEEVSIQSLPASN